jgi:hypothetical protein
MKACFAYAFTTDAPVGVNWGQSTQYELRMMPPQPA